MKTTQLQTRSEGNRLMLAALSSDRHQFANKVREAARSGTLDPFSTTAMKHPALYNDWRFQKERQHLAR